MSKKTKENISISKIAWEKCLTESIKLFGSKNRSGYINYLVLKENELPTGVKITYDKKENIKKCFSPYDNEITNKPLNK